MSTTTTVSATATATTSSQASVAKSARFGAFAVPFGLVGPVAYIILGLWNLPLFTYHPAVGKIGWGWEPAVSGEGPTMYWYGWTANALIIAAIAGILGMMLPEGVSKRMPRNLVWILPILAIPFVLYMLQPTLFHP